MNIFGRNKQTIDLLPEKGKEKSKKINPLTPIILVAIILLQVGIATFLFISNLSASSQLDDLTKQEQEQSNLWLKLQPIANDIKIIKAKLLTYNQKTLSYQGLDAKLNKISTLVPDGVSIDTITVNNKGKTSLVGHSVNPADAYQMVNVIEATKNVTQVSLDTVSKRGSDYSFNISFLIN